MTGRYVATGMLERLDAAPAWLAWVLVLGAGALIAATLILLGLGAEKWLKSRWW